MLRRSALPGPDTCKQQDKRISLVQDYCIPPEKCPKRREKVLKSSEIHTAKILQSQLPTSSTAFFHCRPEGPGPEGTLEAGRGASMTSSSHAEKRLFPPRKCEHRTAGPALEPGAASVGSLKGQCFHRASHMSHAIWNLAKK